MIGRIYSTSPRSGMTYYVPNIWDELDREELLGDNFDEVGGIFDSIPPGSAPVDIDITEERRTTK